VNTTYDILIIGGGAAGFFSAINIAENNSKLKIAILERGNEVLTKVKVSGGGRCNVTHAEFIPKDLTENYPRGEKELLGPFHTFMTGDTVAWFEERGIELKTEDDGRMFPKTNSSQTIIDCFLKEVNHYGIALLKNHSVKEIFKKDSWIVNTNSESFSVKKIVIATGSNPKIWKLLENLGHTITPPVASLFTFNINDERIKDIPGIATQASVKIISSSLFSEGPLLITHWGLSGPAILKLSAWGARILHGLDYTFSIKVNWLVDFSSEKAFDKLKDLKNDLSKQTIFKYAQFELPKRLWRSLVKASSIIEDQKWAETTNKQLQNLASQLTESVFEVNGKSTFKEEFVTAGGVDLKEVNFKRYESKLHKNLFFAGEVLNVDAITGGFNFQNAWTGGYIVAKSISNTL